MKPFWRYIFPGLFALVIYTTARVVNDSISGFKFWQRDWKINLIEVGTSILMGYVISYVLQLLFKRFDKSIPKAISYKTVLYELFWVLIIVEVCNNLVLTPMAALSDDGLSRGDLVIINILPVLFWFIYYGITRSNKLLEAYVHNKLLLEKTTNDHLKTELKFLKAQYHPHFLFNGLNTIYFQMDENVCEAKETVEKFSELLRYQLYDQQQTVKVSSEIQYLQNFIDLQKIRSSRDLKLKVSFDEELNGEQIYPLLFLPLIENAFKYVGGAFTIYVSLHKKNDELIFIAENSMPNEIRLEKPAGIGLENLKRRLELLYPGRHVFTTKKGNDIFVAELKLKIIHGQVED